MTSQSARSSRVYAVLPHMAQVEAGAAVMDRFRDLDPAAQADVANRAKLLLCSGVEPTQDLFGDRVKIGTTTNLAKRVTGVPHDRVLASEPGGRDLERARHAEFAGLRVKGEWFQYVEPLVSHVARLARAR